MKFRNQQFFQDPIFLGQFDVLYNPRDTDSSYHFIEEEVSQFVSENQQIQQKKGYDNDVNSVQIVEKNDNPNDPNTEASTPSTTAEYNLSQKDQEIKKLRDEKRKGSYYLTKPRNDGSKRRQLNNFLVKWKKPLFQMIDQKLDLNFVRNNETLSRLRIKDNLSMEDYMKELQYFFREILGRRVFYRYLMLSRALLVKKLIFVKHIGLLQKAFKKKSLIELTKCKKRKANGRQILSRTFNNVSSKVQTDHYD